MSTPKKTTAYTAFVGENLQLAIDAAKIRPAELATLLSVSRGTVTDWLQGKKPPDIVFIVELYRLRGITPNWVYAGDPQGLAGELFNELRRESREIPPEIRVRT